MTLSQRKHIRVFRRYNKLGDGVREMRATAEEIEEFFRYISGRQTTHGDAEYTLKTTPLLVHGVSLLKENGEPWTHGEAEELAGGYQ